MPQQKGKSRRLNQRRRKASALKLKLKLFLVTYRLASPIETLLTDMVTILSTTSVRARLGKESAFATIVRAFVSAILLITRLLPEIGQSQAPKPSSLENVTREGPHRVRSVISNVRVLPLARSGILVHGSVEWDMTQ